MNAIYQGKIYVVGEDDGNNIQLEDVLGNVISVPFSDDTLIIDPTDSEIDGLEYAGSGGDVTVELIGAPEVKAAEAATAAKFDLTQYTSFDSYLGRSGESRDCWVVFGVLPNRNQMPLALSETEADASALAALLADHKELLEAQGDEPEPDGEEADMANWNPPDEDSPITREALEAYGEELNKSITHNGECSVFPNGTEAFYCWAWRELAIAKFGGTEVGFMHEDNPTATVAQDNDGHDFAIIGPFLVDYWLKYFAAANPDDVQCIQCIFDLTDEDDLARVAALYGDRTKWEAAT